MTQAIRYLDTKAKAASTFAQKRWQIILYLTDYFATSRARTSTALNTEEVDGYFLLNAKLTNGFTIPYRQMREQLFIAGENLTNASYQQRSGYPMPGINGMSGFMLTF